MPSFLPPTIFSSRILDSKPSSLIPLPSYFHELAYDINGALWLHPLKQHKASPAPSAQVQFTWRGENRNGWLGGVPILLSRLSVKLKGT
jgi:hypothetical protein